MPTLNNFVEAHHKDGSVTLQYTITYNSVETYLRMHLTNSSCYNLIGKEVAFSIVDEMDALNHDETSSSSDDFDLEKVD